MNKIKVTTCDECPFYLWDRYDDTDVCIHPFPRVPGKLLSLLNIETDKEKHPQCPSTNVLVEFFE